MSDPSGPVCALLDGTEAERWISDRTDGRGATDPSAAGAADLRERVRAILTAVRAEGDAALLEMTERFDGVRPASVRVPTARCREALEALEPRIREALERARRNVERFHAAQRREEPPLEVEPGVLAWREFRSLDRVGVYVPGGRAPYPSSLVMTAVPARVAGCGKIVACSPPGPDGLPAAAVMATAALLEVDELHAVGGAQAVGAMAYGTESVPRVDKIFGPGSRWVDAAKLAVFETVAIDLPAGPSEVVVWGDRNAEPARVAVELLAQAEHGPDSLAVAVLPERGLAEAVQEVLARRLPDLTRAELARSSLAASALLVAADRAEALRWVNALAAEHLVLLREDATETLAEIRHAGSVFLGPDSPVAAGDYATGPNHVLPTGGRSRGAGGLGLDDFGRWMQVQHLDGRGLAAVGPDVVTLAEWEGLSAHADAVRLRLEGAGTEGRGAGDDGTDGGRGDGSGGTAAAGSRRGTAGSAPEEPAEGNAGTVFPVRSHLTALAPYRTARSIHRGGVLLDANESPFGPLEEGREEPLHRYPDPEVRELRGVLARLAGVVPDRVWVGNGSDELIDVLVRTLAEPGEPVGVLSPGYGVHGLRVETHGARAVPVPLDDGYDLDVEATLGRAGGARLIFLCSPNNPTGNLLSRDRVEALLERSRAVVVVDEAYVEFADAPSMAPMAGRRPRLVVLRTLSKAWGLAAARVGWLVAHTELIGSLRKVSLPYPLSLPAQEAALGTLARRERMEERVRTIRRERQRLRDGLEALELRVLPSEANFLLFFVPEPREVQRRLAVEHGLIVRDRSGLERLDGALRVTVGTPAENARFLGALGEVLDR